MTSQNLNRRQARWSLELSRYNFQIIHWPGTKNKADALSRRPDYISDEKGNLGITLLPEDKVAKTVSLTETKGLYILKTEAQALPTDPIIKAIKRGYQTDEW